MTKKAVKKQAKSKIEIPSPFLIPKGRALIILPVEETTTTKSGIEIMTGHNEQVFKIGYVMAVGAGLIEELIDYEGNKRFLEPGDKVHYNTYANNGFMYDGISYLSMSEVDVHGLVPEKDIIPAETPIKKRKRDFDGHDGIKL